jgi:hypothetical protein
MRVVSVNRSAPPPFTLMMLWYADRNLTRSGAAQVIS